MGYLLLLFYTSAVRARRIVRPFFTGGVISFAKIDMHFVFWLCNTNNCVPYKNNYNRIAAALGVSKNDSWIAGIYVYSHYYELFQDVGSILEMILFTTKTKKKKIPVVIECAKTAYRKIPY